MDAISNFEALLAKGQDNAMLRFGLGVAYLNRGDTAKAAEHLRKTLEFSPDYSAAWKAYAKALADGGKAAEAITAYETGIEVAEKKGDIQAAKEMKVFLKRLQKTLAP